MVAYGTAQLVLTAVMNNPNVYSTLFFFMATLVRAQLFSPLPAAQTGVDFVNRLTETPTENIVTYEYFYNGGGVAAGDFNNDGLTDLIFTSNQQNTQLYLNKGNLRFENITDQAGIDDTKGWKTGIALTDVNNDGWLDIYISFSGNFTPKNRKNKLYINQQNLTFKEFAGKYGIDDAGYTSQSTFFDYDQDGDMDLFVVNHNTKLFRNFDAAYTKQQIDPDAGDRLYENKGGRFEDVTTRAGIISNPIGYGLGVVVTDVNNDGWPDLYVSNDYIEQDYLYVNQQDGTFSDQLQTQMVSISNFSMGVDAGDINNDGLMDLVTLDMLPEDNYRQKLLFAPDNFELYNNMVDNGFHYQSMRNMLQLNNGDGTFSEIGQLAGISSTDWSWAPLLADFNNDGFLDLYITNGYGRDMINRDVMKFYFDERLKHIEGKKSEQMFDVLQGVPSTPLQNYLYLNNGQYQFDNKTLASGLEGKDYSHGAIYADLDNDGDLEIVVNCMNEPAKLFKNQTVENAKTSNYLKIKLAQDRQNRFGFGTKITVFTRQGQRLTREFNPVHGFQSAVVEPLHFGLGPQQVDSIQVVWDDRTVQTLKKDIRPNQLLTITKQTSKPLVVTAPETLFDVHSAKLPYKHQELLVNDFKVQPLLPYMISYHGPKIKVVDLNNDQLDDLFIGGPEGQAPTILLQSTTGEFEPSEQPFLDASSYYEDVNASFFDADADGDLDLYIVSGGFGTEDSGLSLEDRLYINNDGLFVPSQNLPLDEMVGSVSLPWDFDMDGDLDLFVGTRVKQAAFPQTAPSMLLVNNGQGRFVSKKSKTLNELGLVKDAAVADFDGDGQQELLVIGDWDYPKIYRFKNYDLVEVTEQFFDTSYSGWWNTLEVNDIDNDGDLDVFLGNWGENNQFKTSAAQPMELFYDDFDGNGYIDPIWCYYIQGESYPNVLRDEITDQMVTLRKKFVTYEAYANATMETIFSPEQIEKAPKRVTDFLATVWFENKGGKFILHHFPIEVNFSSVNALLIDDFDQDGHKDILMGGNTHYNRVRIGNCETTYGIYLKGKGNHQFEYVPNHQTQISISGSVRSLESVRTPSGPKIVVGINNDYPLLLNLQNTNR